MHIKPIRSLTFFSVVVFKASSGNIARIGVWSSVVPFQSPSTYDTVNASDVLKLYTSDGRDDSVKICNGIGACDFKTGSCTCPYVRFYGIYASLPQ
jgi:hypothetical protein